MSVGRTSMSLTMSLISVRRCLSDELLGGALKYNICVKSVTARLMLRLALNVAIRVCHYLHVAYSDRESVLWRMSVSQDLNILFVEDQELDAELCEHELRQAGLQFKSSGSIRRRDSRRRSASFARHHPFGFQHADRSRRLPRARHRSRQGSRTFRSYSCPARSAKSAPSKP